MHYSKLIAKEFALGIVAKKLNKVISWATFVEETDTNQRSKYFMLMSNMELQRKDLMKVGKVLWLKHESQVEEDFWGQWHKASNSNELVRTWTTRSFKKMDFEVIRWGGLVAATCFYGARSFK
jgi:hypothetical protein